MWDVLSALGISASSEMCKPSSHPCLLYVETYVRFVSIFSSTIQFQATWSILTVLVLYALVIFPSVFVYVIEAEVRYLWFSPLLHCF